MFIRRQSTVAGRPKVRFRHTFASFAVTNPPTSRRFGRRGSHEPDPLHVSVLLFLTFDAARDRLVALEFGHVEEGQPPSDWLKLTSDFRWLAPGGVAIGFTVERFSRFDPEAGTHAAIWDQPFFDVPQLGLVDASVGEIIIAARSFFDGRSSVNRVLYDQAMEQSGEEALKTWRACLEAGDMSAHYGLGRTLYELGRLQEAYRHLRHFAELAPHHTRHWYWYGKAAHELGLWQEARFSYEIAIELESEGGEPTDADELLDTLPPAD